MIKNNKWKLIISSAVILLPIIIGLLLWNELPGKFATHWGADGVADGWSNKTFAVFGLPCFILIINWICVFITAKDPKNKDQNKKAFGMVLWICPFISLFTSGVMYAVALGMELDMVKIMPAIIGLMFVFVGNYMPKCKQNNTIGIRLPWTLSNEENWNKTHRLGGKVWVIGGLLLMLAMFLPREIIPLVLVPIVVIIALIPTVYSYVIYKKQLKSGEYVAMPKSKFQSILTKVSLVMVVIILTGVLVLLFTGNIEVQYGENSFAINATYWSDLEIDYSSVESIEFREKDDVGSRTNGFGSPRLLMGTFQNDEFGYYTRYSYTDCDACIVLEVEGKTLVISGIDDDSTKAIYDELLKQIEQ